MPKPPDSPKLVLNGGSLARIIKEILDATVFFESDSVTGTSNVRFSTSAAGYVIVMHPDGSVGVTVGPKGKAAYTQGGWQARWADAGKPHLTYDGGAQHFKTRITDLAQFGAALELSAALAPAYNRAVAEH